MEVILKIGILGFGAIFGYLFGEVDLLVKVLVCFIVADYISGLLASGYLGELSSKMGFKGIAKKNRYLNFSGYCASNRFDSWNA